MKIFTKISIVLAAVVVLAACKYEEGPGISLRSKRDRVSNEWKFTKYEHNGVDVLNKVVASDEQLLTTEDGESGQFIMSIFRTGYYAINFVMADGSTFHITSNDVAKKDTNAAINRMTANLPASLDAVRNQGTWSFDKKHSNIQLHPDLAYDSTESKDNYNWEIVMLKEKMLKVKGTVKGEDFSMTFEPLNEEDFWW